ncbi:MAG: hypothetical protein Q7J06_00260, partial [Bacteroidales bacterium]|nr:hypothetical protein [Bacteroidales bacterium]
MKTKLISILKPNFHSDIYTNIVRSEETPQEMIFKNLLNYEVENKKIFLFIDFLNKSVYSYWTRTEAEAQEDKLTLNIFSTNEKLLKYLLDLKKFSDEK